jgi:hypothetical protein
MPTYVVAALLSIFPLTEVVVSAWPTRFRDPAWRLAAVGTGMGALTMVLLSLFLILVVGSLAESETAEWVVVIGAAAIALACLVGAATFALDSLQVRAQVRPADAPRYNAAATLALAKISFAGLTAALLAINAFGTARNQRLAAANRPRSASPTVASAGKLLPTGEVKQPK